MPIPQFSAPLAKAIRTSEGILVYVINLGLAAGALLDPSKLPPREAAIVGSALAGLHVASRTLLKVVAVQAGVGVGAPIAVPKLPVSQATAATVVADAVKAVNDPAAALKAVEALLPTDAEEATNSPISTASAVS